MKRFINLFAENELHSLIKIHLQNILAVQAGQYWKPITSSFVLHLFCYSYIRSEWELAQHHVISINKTYMKPTVGLGYLTGNAHWINCSLLHHISLIFACILKIGRLGFYKQIDSCAIALSVKRHCMINSHLHQTLLSPSHFLCPLPLTWNWTLPLCFILSWKQGNTTRYMSIWPLWTRKKLSNVMPCGSIKPIKDASWILAVLGKENKL